MSKMKLCGLGGYRLNSDVLDELKNLGYIDTHLTLLHPMLADYFDDSVRCRKRVLELTGSELTTLQVREIVDKSYRLRPTRLRRLARRLLEFYLPDSNIFLRSWDYLSITPPSLFLRQRVRFQFFNFLAKLKRKNVVTAVHNSNEVGFAHNRKQMLDFSSSARNRTERIMAVLRSIQSCNFAKSKTLVIGPRNESEIFLLKAYGFKTVEAIDLFTYSPLIKPMDMNKLAYPDSSFDIYYSSYVTSVRLKIE